MKEKLLTFESGKAKEFFLNKLSFMTNSKELHKNMLMTLILLMLENMTII